ncbi:MAG: hypothetical protein Q8Q09_28275 [Deltaproteobacteria bacterium]|nr:hypothetical protein [Deltaproteobacteria bacterium]
MSALVCAALLLAYTRDTQGQSVAPIAGARPACAIASQQSVFNGVAYNHIVSVDNQCSHAVQCVVTTDVNPTPSTLVVSAGAHASTNTFLGSPSRMFVPVVRCESIRVR